MIARCLPKTEMVQCVFSSSPARAAGRATCTTTRMSRSIIDGEFVFEVGDEQFRLGAGEPGKIIHVYQR